MNNRLFGLALAVLLLAGCTSFGNKPQPILSDPQQHQQKLLALDNWQLEGKLGYRSQEQSGSALLHWQQEKKAFELQLSGPFGFKTARIIGNAGHAELRQSGVTHYTASSATELTALLFGWAWPVDDLLFWIKGTAAPDSPVVRQQLDEQGLLLALEQSGWALTFADYQLAGSLLLPGRVKGNRGELAFTLVIKGWQL